jgi:hypothetical protein
MEPGFELDSRHITCIWYPGTPEPSKLLGQELAIVKVDMKRSQQMTTYRCIGCGFLEYYAKEQLVSF